MFASFDWQVHSVDATQYDGVYAALEQFRYGPRNGKPTAIICHGMKGHGALSDFLNKHKVTVAGPADRAGTVAAGGAAARRASSEFTPSIASLDDLHGAGPIQDALEAAARQMHLDVTAHGSGELSLAPVIGPVQTRRVPPRDKKVAYDAEPAAEPRSQEGIRRQRHRDRGDEDLRARFGGGLDRFRSGHDQRPRGGRGRRRSDAAR